VAVGLPGVGWLLVGLVWTAYAVSRHETGLMALSLVLDLAMAAWSWRLFRRDLRRSRSLAESDPL
jgi:hypothetical protein